MAAKPPDSPAAIPAPSSGSPGDKPRSPATGPGPGGSQRGAVVHEEDWDEAQRIADLAMERQILESSQLRFLQKLHSDLVIAGSHKSLYQVLEASKIIPPETLAALREEVRQSKPQKLADYELLAQLGHGATGQMYRVRHAGKGFEAALRVISPALVSDPKFVEAFLAGGKTASRLNHPHLVQTLEVGNDRGTYYVVSEIIEGESLEQSVADHGPLPALEALQVAEHILLALTYIHKEGVRHLNIRPENILLDSAAKITRLADTGHAKPQMRRDKSPLESAEAANRPTYAAPEQIFGSSPGDARTDLYSLGACLYFALTGKPPVTSMELAKLSLERGMIFDPAREKPELSPATVEFVRWLTQWSPDARPADAQEALKKLVLLLAQLKTQLKKSNRVDVTAADRGPREAPPTNRSSERRRKSRRLPESVSARNRTTVMAEPANPAAGAEPETHVVLPKYVLFAAAVAIGIFLGGVLAAAILLFHR